jgi:mannose-6-phosphate isomerase-like protein (cupin superfamily)
VQVVGANGPTFHEVWNTRETPVLIDRNGTEPAEPGLKLAPPKGGTRIRVLDIPPDSDELQKLDAAAAREHFALVGAADASTRHAPDARHAFMHRTESVDYGIVLEGEITLIMDVGETIVRSGDIVVQRGTNHGWANRSGKNCRIAFILIDGRFTDGLG